MFCRTDGRAITLRIGLRPAEEFSTLVHELAHETLHERDANGGERPSLQESLNFRNLHRIGLGECN